ncbi:serine hydrolase domain-containing protein [Maricaulis salignorans]|uniref:CubicO group peptidase, beta-lactamase class C family n=1 Tax=Maricaulis salignorans TaxID=144026 RepID=A0A1G9UU17_9PROT|nr:serine hydrolase domain-containing protein [Maricaulis salignorans]SDM63454.1 CubicO group peptidase, beta-lactamase class C family [Maricaulis salignorans]
MMIRNVAIALAVLASPTALAQSAANDARLAALAQQARAASGSPAVAVMLWQDGETRIGVAGVRAEGSDVAVTPDDLWHIGSDTKAMTAMLAARLVEAGVISWDDTIGEHLGGVIEDMDPAYPALTFRHLLSHRAGLPANIGLVDMIRFQMEGTGGRSMPEQRLDYALRMLRTAPAADAETEFLYSNAGYVVAGAMLEQATGQSWENLMAAQVFEPLGLASAGFGPPGSADELDQPRGHRSGLLGGLTAVPPGPRADNPPVLGPAGTVHVSLVDLGRYLGAQMAGNRGEAGDYLTADSWQTLHTPPFGGDYALGWALQNGRLIHAGSNTMWFVQIVMDPQRDRAVVIAFNDGRVDRVAPTMAPVFEALLPEAD